MLLSLPTGRSTGAFWCFQGNWPGRCRCPAIECHDENHFIVTKCPFPTCNEAFKNVVNNTTQIWLVISLRLCVYSLITSWFIHQSWNKFWYMGLHFCSMVITDIRCRFSCNGWILNAFHWRSYKCVCLLSLPLLLGVYFDPHWSSSCPCLLEPMLKLKASLAASWTHNFLGLSCRRTKL